MYRGGKRAHGHRHGHPLSAEEKKEICKRIRAGEKQIKLATEYRCHPAAIARCCKAAGIGRWNSLTPQLGKKAVALLREGRAVYRVAKATRLQGRVIREIMAKHGIVHPVGGGPKLKPELRAAIADACAHRSDYLVYLAEKFQVHKTTVRTIARQVLGDAPFIGYPGCPPLTSHFPQKHPRVHFADPPIGYAAIVEKVCNLCFDGRLPAIPDARLVAAIMAGLPFLAGECDAVLDNFRQNLAQAVASVRLGQTVMSTDLVN